MVALSGTPCSVPFGHVQFDENAQCLRTSTFRILNQHVKSNLENALTSAYHYDGLCSVTSLTAELANGSSVSSALYSIFRVLWQCQMAHDIQNT